MAKSRNVLGGVKNLLERALASANSDGQSSVVKVSWRVRGNVDGGREIIATYSYAGASASCVVAQCDWGDELEDSEIGLCRNYVAGIFPRAGFKDDLVYIHPTLRG